MSESGICPPVQTRHGCHRLDFCVRAENCNVQLKRLNDMRDAKSVELIHELVKLGATVVAYDPIAMTEAKRVFGDAPYLAYATSPLAACDGADALVVVTEWKEFRSPDFDAMKAKLQAAVVFDGRNLYEPAFMKTLGIDYQGIGRSAPAYPNTSTAASKGAAASFGARSGAAIPAGSGQATPIAGSSQRTERSQSFA